MSELKPSNPKDAVGIRKAGMSYLPQAVLYEVALAMMEGHLKGYGRHNFRVVGVRASVYYDACRRHIDEWFEGQDIDVKCAAALHNIPKAIACLVVLYDAILRDMCEDDRPPRMPDGWLDRMNDLAGDLMDKFPNPPTPAYTQKALNDNRASTSEVEGELVINLDEIVPQLKGILK